jgi:hypothetical protein
MKRILLIMMFTCAFAWSEEPAAPTRDVMFQKAYLGFEGGMVYPWGDLLDAVDKTYYGLMEFRYQYWENVSGVVQFGYAYFETLHDADYPGVHQFNGRIGVDYPPKVIHPISIGAGFSCIWARADGDDVDPEATTLDDNESEFGWYARLVLPIVNTATYQVGAHAYWESIWTRPETSEMLWFGLYIERKLW